MRAHAKLLFTAAIVAAALAITGLSCGTSSVTSTSPAPLKCQVSLTSSITSVDASGAAGSVTVTTEPECTWTAAAQVSWITVPASTSGRGNGQFNFQVAPNPDAASRRGGITVNGQLVNIDQVAAECHVAVAPAAMSIGATGGSASLTVTATSTCSWTATTSAPWIGLPANAAGAGNGNVAFTVAGNTASVARSGTITVAGQTSTVNQAALTTCTNTISPTSQGMAASGGQTTVAVTAGPDCTWTASSNADWITLPTIPNTKGNGSVTLSVSANGGAARSGTVVIAGQLFTITQAAPDSGGTPGCTFTLQPATGQFTSGTGGTVTVSVAATRSDCTWTAATTASWITITSGARGTGNGNVVYVVAANTGPPRTDIVTIAGFPFTANQGSGCSYGINPTSTSVGSAGGAGAPVGVTASDAGCTWTASSNAGWITITSGTSGSGNGSVSYTVDANTGSARSDTITIAGQTFTVNQAAAACSFNIAPMTVSPGAAGGPGTVTITQTSGGSGCSWTAVSHNPAMIVLTPPTSGTGSGSVSYVVTPNIGGARTGTATIAGQTFTVHQAAAACTFTIAPTTAAPGADGGPGSVTVTLATGPSTCAWTSVSHVPWITPPSSGGNGSGTANYVVAANTGTARSGTMTIAGHTFTVNQSLCTYGVPSPVTLGPGAQSGLTFSVTAGAGGCNWTWTAVSNTPSMITITSGTGSGNGTVTYSVTANTGGTNRTGTISVGGATFTVMQNHP